MKFTTATFVSLALAMQTASAHYIFGTLVAGGKTSTAAVRTPINNSPIADIMSNDARCGTNPGTAKETVTVAAGSKVGFQTTGGVKVFHVGPAALYLGKAPGSVADWDGSGQTWFKIAEWGPTSTDPYSWSALDKNEFTATIPPEVPPGEYLARMEHIALHQPGIPEFYVGCGQIKVTGSGTAQVGATAQTGTGSTTRAESTATGTGQPATVSIPGHLSRSDPGLTVDVYNSKGAKYQMPGPALYQGF